MKGFDPHLIRFGIFALVFVVKAISSMNRKRKQSNDRLRPPQSASGPAPIGSPTMNQSRPPVNPPPMPMPRNSPQSKSSGAGEGSPWSSSKGPFD